MTTTLPQALQTAFDQLASGQIYWGVRTLVNAINPLGITFLYQVAFSFLPALQIPTVMAQNFADVVPRVLGLATTLTTMVGGIPLIALEVPLADTQRFVDALGAGDGMGALNILANAPARFTDALLNGYITDPEFPEFRDGGLLSSLSVLSILANNLPGSLMPTATPKTTLSRVSGLLNAPSNIAAPDPSETEAPQENESPREATTLGDTAAATAESSPAEDAPDSATAEATAPTEESAVTDAATPLVRESLVAAPGKASTRPAIDKAAADVVADVRDGISATAKKIGKGVKKAFTKPDKPAKADATKSDAGTSGGGKHRAGAGTSGDAK